MVMGSRGAPHLLAGRPGVEALVVERNFQRWQTSGVAAALHTG